MNEKGGTEKAIKGTAQMKCTVKCTMNTDIVYNEKVYNCRKSNERVQSVI